MEAFGTFLPLILIFAVFYFLLIRPQQRKVKQHKEMLSNLKRGDKIITSGGIICTVNKVADNRELTVEISDNVEIKTIKIDPQIIEKILNFASIKYILDKKNLTEDNVIAMLRDIMRDLKNLELESRIEELEAKFLKDFSEITFNQLKELKKLQKIN